MALREKLKHSQRDLRRRPDSSPHFEPAPAPDQLLRIATAGLGSQVLLFALTASLFDHLERWRTARELARELGLNNHGLAEVLECLVSLGLLECGPEGYRNLELASRYLNGDSPQTLKPLLLSLAAQLPPAISVGRYVLNGRSVCGPPESPTLEHQACECLARFAAPFVADRLDLPARGRVLLVGWGGPSYRGLISPRWPELQLEIRNPFETEPACEPAAAVAAAGGRFGAVLFSGLLACCERMQFRPALESASRVLEPDGLLILHDAFLSSEAPPPPEVILSALGRHLVREGSRNWPVSRLRAELEALGLRMLRVDPIPGGTQLVIAQPV
ncbi:MAG: hypothetical protein M1436_06335 [Acidobacteria bacterium]|nr:hypothetical protein [Acidobacteriota bacterium]